MQTAHKGRLSSLGVGLRASNSSPQTASCYESLKKVSELEWSFGTTYLFEKGHEIWYMEY